MRIIAGLAKGRRIAAPPSGTRPMTGRARESLFAILGHRIEGADVLDLYAGSGSLGLESLSRGAASATFVERSRKASRIIAENIAAVGLGGTVVTASAATAIERTDARFDVIFIDPPYRDADGEVAALVGALERVLAEGGLVVVHRQSSSTIAVPEFLTCTDERRYGDAVVTMMERPVT